MSARAGAVLPRPAGSVAGRGVEEHRVLPGQLSGRAERGHALTVVGGEMPAVVTAMAVEVEVVERMETV